MKDIMVDLETWCNGANAVVVQIGACMFDRNTGEIGKKFLSHVNAETEMDAGFGVDASTIYWWMEREKQAQGRAHGLKHQRKTSQIAWSLFNDFLGGATYIWSHATFDYPIIMNHFYKLGIKPNIHYRNARDIRTLVDIAGRQVAWQNKREGVHHDALDDAVFQVGYCVECFSYLKENILGE